MYPRTQEVSIITSTATLDGTDYFAVDHGRVLSVQYASTTLESTGSYAVTNNVTGEAILTHAPAASTPTYYPRKAICDSTGGTVLYSTAGGSVSDYFFVADQQLKIVLTNCGSGVTATFRVTIG